MNVSEKQIRVFQRKVWNHFKKHKRDLPWRKTFDPYCILVSEIMLQQTQVIRVVEKYQLFIKRFPTVLSLAEASFRDVLSLWQGLGYNRRALFLHQSAQLIISRYGGVVPADRVTLDQLPGIGSDTAGAICVYAFQKPEVFLETNIRTVFIHTFFPRHTQVSDQQLRPLVARACDTQHPRLWYSALMDYGVYIKKTEGNIGKKSVSYTKQSLFKGSNRQVRGFIIAQVTKKHWVSISFFYKQFGTTKTVRAVEGLLRDKLIVREGSGITSAS